MDRYSDLADRKLDTDVRSHFDGKRASHHLRQFRWGCPAKISIGDNSLMWIDAGLDSILFRKCG